MVRLATETNVRIILYRVSRRPGVEEVPSDYIEALRAYSKEHGTTYLEEKELFGVIPLEWYADGDHIRPTYKKDYSIKLGLKLKDRLQ